MNEFVVSDNQTGVPLHTPAIGPGKMHAFFKKGDILLGSLTVQLLTIYGMQLSFSMAWVTPFHLD